MQHTTGVAVQTVTAYPIITLEFVGCGKFELREGQVLAFSNDDTEEIEQVN
jgi:hypothetical protein